MDLRGSRARIPRTLNQERLDHADRCHTEEAGRPEAFGLPQHPADESTPRRGRTPANSY